MRCIYCTGPADVPSTGGPGVCVLCEVHGADPAVYMGRVPPYDFHAHRRVATSLRPVDPTQPMFVTQLTSMPPLDLMRDMREVPLSINGQSLAVLTHHDDGRFTLDVTAPISVRFHHTLGVEVDGHMVTATTGDTASLAAGIHHVQPTGGAYHGSVVGAAIDDPKWLQLMVGRDEAYAAREASSRRREFYIRAARRNMQNRRPKRRGRGGCSCPS